MTRVGHGFDAHRLVPGRPCILAGTVVPSERGPLGHSDGDVLAHALADALLGAAALGDLGSRFPEDDPRWEGADSMQLLERCVREIVEGGYAIVNVDATVVVQEPRLAGHVEAMRRNVGRVLGLALERVGIKAKTSDRMGYTGDGSGIAAYAVALIESV